jgi:hypothetical protein
MKRFLKSLATFVFALVALTLFELITSLIPLSNRPSPSAKTLTLIEYTLPAMISIHRCENGTPPSSQEQLRSWYESRGKDVGPTLLDGWKNTIHVLSSQDTVAIISRGPDGILNTGDDIVRVFTWAKGFGDMEFMLRRTYEGDL